MTRLASSMPGLVLAALLAASASARAEPDYDLSPDTWNGLGYLLTTATEAKVTVSTPPSVDLAALSPEDIVFVVYPRKPLPVTDLMAFVESGGYLLVADDRGSASELFAAAGLTRKDDGPGDHGALWADQRGFLRLTPAGEHFLFFNVEEVIANHPAALTFSDAPGASPRPASRVPVLSFEGGREHLLVEVNHGRGKLIAIADASLFINDMLRRFYGNKQLAANLLRYPCLREPCTATLVAADTGFTGRFDTEKARLGSTRKDIADLVSLLNDAVAEASRALAEPTRATWVAGALGLVLAVLLLLLWRAGRSRLSLLRGPAAQTESSPMIDEVRGLLAQAHEGDFGALAPTLASHGVELARRHRLHDLSRRAPEPNAGWDEALMAALIRVESEAVGLSSKEAGVWSAERLLKLHEDVETLRRAALESHSATKGRPRPVPSQNPPGGAASPTAQRSPP